MRSRQMLVKNTISLSKQINSRQSIKPVCPCSLSKVWSFVIKKKGLK